MPKQGDSARRSNNDDSYRVLVLHEEEDPAPSQAFPTLKQQIARDFRRAGFGLVVTVGLLFLSSILAGLGTTGSYWGDWRSFWPSFLPLHLGGLSAVFTVWCCIRALIAALMLRW